MNAYLLHLGLDLHTQYTLKQKKNDLMKLYHLYNERWCLGF